MPPSTKREAGTVGLRLTEAGHPSTWRHVPDYGFLVHPDMPTPCGGLMEPSVELAKQLADDPSKPFELVDIKDPEPIRHAIENERRALRGLPPMEPTTFEGAALEAQQSTTKEA